MGMQEKKEFSKKALKNKVDKKFTTCFIFALSEFENVFGKELWGHNMPENELTPSQIANKKRWENLRKNILDNGNKQKRTLISELERFDVQFMGYRLEARRKNNGK